MEQDALWLTVLEASIYHDRQGIEGQHSSQFHCPEMERGCPCCGSPPFLLALSIVLRCPPTQSRDGAACSKDGSSPLSPGNAHIDIQEKSLIHLLHDHQPNNLTIKNQPEHVGVGLDEISPFKLACLLTLTLLRSYLGGHIVEVSQAKLPCHFLEIGSHSSFLIL